MNPKEKEMRIRHIQERMKHKTGNRHIDSLNEQLDRVKLELLENNGQAHFPGLFDAVTGERLPAKLVSIFERFSGMQYKWVIVGTDGKADEWIRNKPSALRERGVKVSMELAPADARVVGPPLSTGGDAHMFVDVFRTDGGFPGSAHGRKTVVPVESCGYRGCMRRRDQHTPDIDHEFEPAPYRDDS